eukprot:TRINITY_DN81652_c0_g1_i1.p1 TRINITY_DN81652_c0_g1~~TRINITY_DN81652_c0_g1_i1.p1  ORF type:complete len:164 (-),score=21.99 TRINITY_DN81652_c0_g1_i1:280-702(-)
MVRLWTGGKDFNDDAKGSNLVSSRDLMRQGQPDSDKPDTSKSRRRSRSNKKKKRSRNKSSSSSSDEKRQSRNSDSERKIADVDAARIKRIKNRTRGAAGAAGKSDTGDEVIFVQSTSASVGGPHKKNGAVASEPICIDDA